MGPVYGLTLRQLAGRWRLLIMAALAALPVFFSILVLSSRRAPSVAEFETAVLGAMLSGSIGPLVVLAIAAAAFANELEDKTLANLTLSPIPRSRIVLPKLLASITLSAPFVVLSALLTSHLAFLGDSRATLAVTLSLLVGVALYASFFLWLGLISTQAIGIGLLYIVIWEGFFTGFVSGARVLSIRHYAASLMHGLDPRRFAEGSYLSLGAVVVVSLVVFVGFLLLAIRRLRRMDVP